MCSQRCGSGEKSTVNKYKSKYYIKTLNSVKDDDIGEYISA